MSHLRALGLKLLLANALCACGDDDVSDAATDAPLDERDGSEDAALDGGQDGSVDAHPEDAGADDATEDAADDSRSDAADGSDASDHECDDDEDCPDGSCFMHPDAVRRCVSRADVGRDACPEDPSYCCLDEECTDGTGGVCVVFTYQYCGGAAPPPGNSCRYDECQSDSDCSAGEGGACLPAGIAGYATRQCAYGPCRTHADCDEGPGGQCHLESVERYCTTLGFFCSYDDDPCDEARVCEGASPKVCLPNSDGQGRSCVDDFGPPS